MQDFTKIKSLEMINLISAFEHLKEKVWVKMIP